jgi:hypothetical protein
MALALLAGVAVGFFFTANLVPYTATAGNLYNSGALMAQ